MSAGQLRQGTLDSYESHVRRYLAPEQNPPPIAVTPLQRIEKTAIKAFLGQLGDRPRERGTGTLSPKTVHNVFLTLSKSMSDAVEDGLIRVNPATGAHKAPEAAEMKFWTPEQLHAFLAHVQHDRLFAL